jgi:hypothetical protein
MAFWTAPWKALIRRNCFLAPQSPASKPTRRRKISKFMSCRALAAAPTCCLRKTSRWGSRPDGVLTARSEIDKLCDAVLAALETGPLDPDGLREACGHAIRNLGPEGKKKGLTTTLPVALGKLQESGDIRRAPTNGRFDQQRYQYALWRPNPLRGLKLSPEQVHTELARKYFAWIGPASAADFHVFSGLG